MHTTGKPGHYIWINGFPGVGKLTVARELQRKLEGSVLIDNHQLIDVVKLPRDHPEYNIERKRAREEAFAKWVYTDGDEGPVDKEGKAQRIVIFTDCVSSSDLGGSMASEHRAAAEKSGRPFLPIYLQCSREENLARAVSRERLRGTKGKLTDVALLATFLDTLELFRWPGQGVGFDVTKLEPAETAERIISAMMG